MTIAELIANLESAAKGSAELDQAIFLTVTDPRDHRAWWGYHGMRQKGLPDDPEGFAKHYAPKYTRSLDAALSLVAGGYGVGREERRRSYRCVHC